MPRRIVFSTKAARPPPAYSTVVLAEEDDFAGMNEEWLKWFPIDPPARQGAIAEA